MNSIKVCEYSRSRSFHDDLILQDQASGERSQDHWSSGSIMSGQSHYFLVFKQYSGDFFFFFIIIIFFFLFLLLLCFSFRFVCLLCTTTVTWARE